MYDYYCKNCNNIVKKFNNKYEWYDSDSYFCNYIRSKKFKSIYFLDCINCNKFVGIFCYHVCTTCFGENEILGGEEKLKKWFSKHKKIIYNEFCCGKCNTTKFRWQHWFFEELTFYK